MSIEVVALVLRAKTGLGTQAKMVLLGLADHARADGTEARPGVATLSQYAECSDRTVQRHLRALEDEGFIGRQRESKSRPTVYRISLPALASMQPASRGDAVSPAVTGVDLAPQVSDRQITVTQAHPDNVSPHVSVSPPEPVGGDTPVTEGVTDLAPRGDTALSPEPSLQQPSSEPSETAAAVAAAVPVERDLFEAICIAFGWDWSTFTPKSDVRGAINRQVPQLIAAGIYPHDVAAYVRWLAQDPDSPLVEGRRLTVGSLGKWATYWKSRPVTVHRSQEPDDLAGKIRARLDREKALAR